MSAWWANVFLRYGGSGDGTAPAQLAEAIAEIYHEDLPGMGEGDYEEHGAAWLECGRDGGPMYVLYVTRGRKVTFEQWADTDFEVELTPALELQDVSEEYALQLWTWLSQGQLDLVKSQPWQPPSPTTD